MEERGRQPSAAAVPATVRIAATQPPASPPLSLRSSVWSSGRPGVVTRPQSLHPFAGLSSKYPTKPCWSRLGPAIAPPCLGPLSKITIVWKDGLGIVQLGSTSNFAGQL